MLKKESFLSCGEWSKPLQMAKTLSSKLQEVIQENEPDFAFCLPYNFDSLLFEKAKLGSKVQLKKDFSDETPT